MHTSRTAVYDAKNRYDLPDTIPLDWDTFARAVAAATPASPARLRSEIETLLPKASPETQEKVRIALGKVGDNAAQLARMLNKLSAEIALLGEGDEPATQGDGQ